MSRNRTVTVEHRGANHGLHLVLTILTCGVWAITGWPIAAMMGRKTKTVTRAPQPMMMQPQPSPYPPQQYGQQPAQYGYQQPPQQYPPQGYPQQQGWQPPQ
jgi:hypothetical protein